MGNNVIQTFCVSCNGYAWYKNGVVPEQPGLKHDFLREVVRLGHAEKRSGELHVNTWGTSQTAPMLSSSSMNWAAKHP